MSYRFVEEYITNDESRYIVNELPDNEFGKKKLAYLMSIGYCMFLTHDSGEVLGAWCYHNGKLMYYSPSPEGWRESMYYSTNQLFDTYWGFNRSSIMIPLLCLCKYISDCEHKHSIRYAC